MKKLRRFLMIVLAALCATAGIAALAACSDGKDPADIGAEYRAIYNVYSEKAGANAKSLEEWYADLTAGIARVNAGEVSKAGVAEIDGEQYVKLDFANGKLYMAPILRGGVDLKEYAAFALTAKDAQDALVTGLYLDVYYIKSDNSRERVQTVQTHAVRGTADVYADVSLARVFYVTVNAQSASYGIPYAYEPALDADGAKEVEVVVGTPATYTATVKNKSDAPLEGVSLALRYAEGEAHSGVVIATATTDGDGTASFSYTPHTGSGYEIAVTSVGSDYTLPAAAFAADPSGSSEIKLDHVKWYSSPERDPVEHEAASAPTNSPALPANRDMELITGSAGTLTKDAGTGYYYYASADRPAFLALTVGIDRVFGGKSIEEILDEDADYFVFERCEDEATNEWAWHDYAPLLRTYIEKVNAEGLYPVNDELYEFICAAAEQHLFTRTGSDTSTHEAYLALYQYSWAKLGLGADGAYSAGGSSQAIPLAHGITDGYYNLTVTMTVGSGTGSAGLEYMSCVASQSYANGMEFARHARLNAVVTDQSYSGYIYLSANTPSIHITHSGGTRVRLNQITLERVDTLAPIDLVSPSEDEITVYAIPESWVTLVESGSEEFGSVDLFANFYTQSRTFATFTVTPEQKEGVDGLKVHQFYRLRRSVNQQWRYTTYINTTEINGGSPSSTTKEFDSFNDNGSSMGPGFLITHTGSDLIQIKVRVTASYSRYYVTYEGGEGAEGETYTSSMLQGGAEYDVLPNGGTVSFSKNGYAFDGWTYTDGTGEHTVQPGETITVNSDITLTAKWKLNHPQTAEDPLGVGEENKAEITLDPQTYTSTEVSLQNVAAGEYVITATASRQISGFYLVVDGVRAYFSYDASASQPEQNKYVYVAYIGINEDTALISVPSEDGLDTANVTLVLQEYVAPELGGDDEAVLAPTNPHGGDTFKLLLATDVAPGEYKLTLTTTSSMSPALKIVTASGETDALISNGERYTYFTVGEGDREVWLVGAAGAVNYLSSVSASMHRVYTVKFEAGEAADNAQGSVASRNHLDGNTAFNLPTSGFTWEYHVLTGWKVGAEGTVYRRGESFTVTEDVTLVAQWREENINDLVLNIGGAAGHIAIDPAKHTSVRINYDETVDYPATNDKFTNSYVFTADFGNTDYRGSVVLGDYKGASKVFDVALTYSAALSTPNHAIFKGYLKWSGQWQTDHVLKLDLIDYDGPALEGEISFGRYNYADNVVTPSESAEGALINIGCSNGVIPFTINPSTFAGYKYKLHVLDYTGLQGTPRVAQHASATQSASVTDGIEFVETKTYDGYREHIFTVQQTYQYFSVKSSPIGYSYDVWLESIENEDAENALQVGGSVELTLTGRTAVDVALGSTVLQNTQYGFRLDITEGEPPSTTSNYVNVTYNGTNTASLRSSGLFVATGITFTSLQIKVAASYTSANLTATLYLFRYEPVELSTSEGVEASVPAKDGGYAFLHVDNSSAYYDLRIQPQADSDVYTLYYGSSSTTPSSYTLNRENNWTLKCFRVSGGVAMLASEGGACTATVFLTEYIQVDNTAVNTINWAANEEKLFIIANTSYPDRAPYGKSVAWKFKFTITAGEVGDNFQLTIKYGDGQTAILTKGADSSELVSELLIFTEQTFSITCNVDVSFTLSLDADVQTDVELSFAALETAAKQVTLQGSSAPQYVKFVTPTSGVYLSESYMWFSATLSAADGSQADLSAVTLTFSEGNVDDSTQPVTLSSPKDNGNGTYTFSGFLSRVKYAILTVSGASTQLTMSYWFGPAVKLTLGSVSYDWHNKNFPKVRFFTDSTLQKGKQYTFTAPALSTTFNKANGVHKHTSPVTFTMVGETSGTKYTFTNSTASADVTKLVTFQDEVYTMTLTGCTVTSTATSVNGTYEDSCTFTVSEAYVLGVEKDVTITLSNMTACTLMLDSDVQTAGYGSTMLYALKAQFTDGDGVNLTVTSGLVNAFTTTTGVLSSANSYTLSPVAFAAGAVKIQKRSSGDKEVTFSIEEYEQSLTADKTELTVSVPAYSTSSKAMAIVRLDESIKLGSEFYTLTAKISSGGTPTLTLGEGAGTGIELKNANGYSATLSFSNKIFTITNSTSTAVEITLTLERISDEMKLKPDSDGLTVTLPSRVEKTVVMNWGAIGTVAGNYTISVTVPDGKSASFTVKNLTSASITLSASNSYTAAANSVASTKLSFTITSSATETLEVTVRLTSKYADGAKVLKLDEEGVQIEASTTQTSVTLANDLFALMQGVYEKVYLLTATVPEDCRDNIVLTLGGALTATLSKNNNFTALVAFMTRSLTVKSNLEEGKQVTLKLSETDAAGHKATLDGAGIELQLKANEYATFAVEGITGQIKVDIELTYTTPEDGVLPIFNSSTSRISSASPLSGGETTNPTDGTTKQVFSGKTFRTNFVLFSADKDVTVTVVIRTHQA